MLTGRTVSGFLAETRDSAVLDTLGSLAKLAKLCRMMKVDETLVINGKTCYNKGLGFVERCPMETSPGSVESALLELTNNSHRT